MTKIKITVFLLLTCFFSLLYGFEKDVFCEPSLVFPEIFFIETGSSFSYTAADKLYEEPEDLVKYLNYADFSQEQLQVRYLYYLRTQQFMPALTLLMTMVSFNAYPSAFPEAYDEFFNLLSMAANSVNTDALDKSSAFSLENPEMSLEQEKKIKSFVRSSYNERLNEDALSKMLTSEMILNISALNMHLRMRHEDSIFTPRTMFWVISYSFKTILSNLREGVDLSGDPFFKELFNRFVGMYSDKRDILDSFIFHFVNTIYKTGSDISLYHYLLLRKYGMIENAAQGWISPSEARIAEEWITDTRKQKELPAFSDFFKRDSEACGFLEEKEQWIGTMEMLGSEEKQDIIRSIRFSKMIEQCRELDYLGLEKSDNVTIDPSEYPKWALNLSNALDKILRDKMSEDDAVKTLKKGLLAAIMEVSSSEKRFDMDMYELMMFIYRHKNCDSIIKAIMLKQINGYYIADDSGSYQEAVRTISDFLY